MLKLIKELGKKDKLSYNHTKSVKEFIWSVVYADESSKNYVDTRPRINLKNKLKLKKKNIYGYPSDPDSGELAIKKVHLQTFTWLRCCEQNIEILIEKNLGGNYQMVN